MTFAPIEVAALDAQGKLLGRPVSELLGVEVDLGRVEELHERFLRSGRTVRNDGDYMRRRDPSFTDALPRY